MLWGEKESISGDTMDFIEIVVWLFVVDVMRRHGESVKKAPPASQDDSTTTAVAQTHVDCCILSRCVMGPMTLAAASRSGTKADVLFQVLDEVRHGIVPSRYSWL